MICNSKRYVYILYIVALLVSGACLAADAGAELKPLPCETFRLENGVQVVFMEKHDSPAVAIYAYVKTGSIYEGEFLGCGISHYLEHLVSGGTTKNRTEKASSLLLKQIGDDANAYTTLDHTCYHIQTTRDHWQTAAELIADWLGNCALAPEEVEREKGVIVQEIRMGEEEPSSAMWNLLQKTAYLRSEVRVPTIGYEVNFKRLTRADALEYYNQWYVANNVIVSVVGDVRRDELKNALEATFGKIKRGRSAEWLLTPEPRQTAPRRATQRFNVQHAHVELAFPSIPLDHPDLYALDLLAQILSAGESSILVKKLKDEMQLVYSITASSWTPSYARGFFSLGFTCDETNLDATVSALCRELEALKTTAVEPRHIERARRQILVRHFRDLQTARGLAAELGSNLRDVGDPNFGVRYVRGIQGVTAEDVMRVAGTYFDTNRTTLAALLPARDASATSATAEAAPAADTFNFSVRRLKNGIRLALRPDATLPLVAFSVCLPGGLIYETPENNGMSSFLAGMLTKGAAGRTADDIARAVEELGASLSYNATRDSVRGRAECLSSDVPTVLELLADTLRSPSFPHEEIEKQRRLTLAGIRARKESWWREGFLNFTEVFFKGHPFSMPMLGSTNVVEHLNADDLRAFHARVLQPSNIVIAVAGSFEEEELEALLDKHFGSIKATATPLPKPPPARPVAADRIITRDAPRKQTTILLGYPGATLDDPARYPMMLIDSFLGGFGGPLLRALRGEDDLVYIVFAFPLIEIDAGALVATAQCKPSNAGLVLSKMTNVVHALAAGELSTNQVALAKNAVLIPYQLSRQTVQSLADNAALWEYRGKGANYGKHFADKINAVNATDIRATASNYFQHWTCVMTTPDNALKSVRAFLDRYPEAKAQDVYKIVFQGTAGPAHLGTNKEKLRKYVAMEWQRIKPEDGPLWLPIGIDADWAWLNLKAWKKQGGDVDTVVDALCKSVEAPAPDSHTLSQNWMRVAEAIDAGKIKLNDPEWRQFHDKIVADEFPVVHHSSEFIKLYDPAYFVLSRSAW